MNPNKLSKARWAAKRRFPVALMMYTTDTWWTEVRKHVLDVMIRACNSNGILSLPRQQIANYAGTTKGNVSKIVAYLEDCGILNVTRTRHRGAYKNEQNIYQFPRQVWQKITQNKARRKPMGSYQESVNNKNNKPHKGIKKDLYATTVSDSCEKTVEIKPTDISNRPKPSTTSPKADKSSNCFPRETMFWSNIDKTIKDKITLSIAQFDTELSKQFKDTQTAQEVLDVLTSLREQFGESISKKTLERLFYKIHNGQPLTLHVCIHFMATLSKIHFTTGWQTIRNPERFFAGTLERSKHRGGTPKIWQLLDSLERMTNDNASRYQKTIRERINHRNQLEIEKATKEQDNKIMIPIAQFRGVHTQSISESFSRVHAILRSEYGASVYKTWLGKIILNKNTLIAPKSASDFITEQFLPRIINLMKKERIYLDKYY